jgi:hypothetical protein
MPETRPDSVATGNAGVILANSKQSVDLDSRRRLKGLRSSVVHLAIGNCSRVSGRTSSTGQGAWSRTNRATCPTDLGPIEGLPPYSARGQMITKSARHSAATFTISRSGRP